MTTRSTADQIAFRYRAAVTTTGVTRDIAKRLADHMCVDETQAIHLALHELAVKMLPQYEADDGPLTAAQMRQILKMRPKARSVRCGPACSRSSPHDATVVGRAHGRLDRVLPFSRPHHASSHTATGARRLYAVSCRA